MSILAPIGFSVCMGVFVLYGLWTDEKEQRKALQAQTKNTHLF